MVIFHIHRGCESSNSDKTKGVVEFQQLDFSMCEDLTCWMRWGAYVFRFGEVLWYLGGNPVDYFADDFKIEQITNQIIKLTGERNFEQILKNCENKINSDYKYRLEFQSWDNV